MGGVFFFFLYFGGFVIVVIVRYPLLPGTALSGLIK